MSADPENWYPLHDSEDIDFTKIMKPTPRTDAVVAPYIGCDEVSGEEANALLDHARKQELRIAQLEHELEEAKRESEDRNQQWAAKSIYAHQLEQKIANLEAALEKARKALEQHIMRCNWSRHGYGPCTCPHDTRIKEALTAINELKSPNETKIPV